MSHYDTLELDPDASEEAIRQAYRRQAQATHPDREGGDPETFHAVQRAYEVLSDPSKREHYDRTGDDDIPEIERIAEARLMALFEQLIQADYPGDLIERARDAVEDSTREFQGQRKRHKQNLKRIERARDRVKRTDNGPNAYQRLIDGKIRNLRGEVQQLDREIETNDVVLELLKHYRDEGPPEPEAGPEATFGAAHWDARV